MSPKGVTCSSIVKCFGSLFSLLEAKDFLVSVENTPKWRLHQVFAHKDGKGLRELVVGRISSNMVIMTLMLSTTVAILFSPSDVCTTMRRNLGSNHPEDPIQSIIGHFLLVSIFLALFAIISNFSAWMIIQSASPENSRAIIMSSLGLFATYLPSVLVFFAINIVIIYMMLWVYVLIPDGAAVGTVYSVFVLFIYFFIVATYSSLGRLMLKTSAMASKHILESDSLDTMYSMEVQEQLLEKARNLKQRNKSARTQYMSSEIRERNNSDNEKGVAIRNQMEENV